MNTMKQGLVLFSFWLLAVGLLFTVLWLMVP